MLKMGFPTWEQKLVHQFYGLSRYPPAVNVATSSNSCTSSVLCKSSIISSEILAISVDDILAVLDFFLDTHA